MSECVGGFVMYCCMVVRNVMYCCLLWVRRTTSSFVFERSKTDIYDDSHRSLSFFWIVKCERENGILCEKDVGSLGWRERERNANFELRSQGEREISSSRF